MKSPGEHHFVATYLLPRVVEICNRVPNYVNPDGTKGITGDIVFIDDRSRERGIEVKVDTIRLTKTEFNPWIASRRPSRWPLLFIGLAIEGLVLLPWGDFRHEYIRMVRAKRNGWNPVEITADYGPYKSIRVFFRECRLGGCYPRVENKAQASTLDSEFNADLRRLLVC